MANTVLGKEEIWKVIRAGLLVLGYTDNDDASLSTNWRIRDGGEMRLTIQFDNEEVPPKPYQEKKGLKLVEGYQPGQWKEEKVA